MVHDAALGAVAAHAGTRVPALVAVAGLGAVAVRVRDTLGLAALVRVAVVVGSAAADAEAVVHAAFGVGATATLVARVPFGSRWQSRCQRKVSLERCCTLHSAHRTAVKSFWDGSM